MHLILPLLLLIRKLRLICRARLRRRKRAKYARHCKRKQKETE